MGALVAVMGLGRAGKDTIADYLVRRHHFVRVALADPMKRFCAEVFDFSHQQLHGDERDVPDARYKRQLTFQYPDAPPNAVWVPLSSGRAFALVDADDAARVLDLRWVLVEKEAGKANRYAKATVEGVEVKLHRFIFTTPAEQIDHVNGDGLDNRRSNLRACTNKENHANTEKRTGAASVFKGVSFDAARGKWIAKIAPGGATINLGRFDSEAQAASAYDAAAREHFGAFARCNTHQFLTPRYALQRLGTQWGRDCYPNLWINYGIRTATSVLRGYHYDPVRGLGPVIHGRQPPRGVVFSDLRFQNEFDAMKLAGAILVRVKRAAVTPLNGVAGHASESEQASIPDAAFDVVLNNDGSIEELHAAIDSLLGPRLT